jgi:amidophosphoribosyltransferase
LVQRLRELGQPREIHVRVACPPIISPCFYGIDMSTVGELFAPKYLDNGVLTPEAEARMAAQMGADSLRYLPVDAIARAIGLPAEQLCQACITGVYPTPCGQRLARVAQENELNNVTGRTYENAGARGEGTKKQE